MVVLNGWIVRVSVASQIATQTLAFWICKGICYELRTTPLRRPASGAPTRGARAVGGLGPCPRRVRRGTPRHRRCAPVARAGGGVPAARTASGRALASRDAPPRFVMLRRVEIERGLTFSALLASS